MGNDRKGIFSRVLSWLFNNFCVLLLRKKWDSVYKLTGFLNAFMVHTVGDWLVGNMLYAMTSSKYDKSICAGCWMECNTLIPLIDDMCFVISPDTTGINIRFVLVNKVDSNLQFILKKKKDCKDKKK